MSNLETATGAAAITPSDSGNIARFPTKYVLVTVAGNIAVDMMDGTTGVIPVNANTMYPLAVKKVSTTSTTATGIIAFY